MLGQVDPNRGERGEREERGERGERGEREERHDVKRHDVKRVPLHISPSSRIHAYFKRASLAAAVRKFVRVYNK